MEILDQFFSSQLNGPVTPGMIIASLLVSFLGSLLIIVIYRKTFNGVVYNRSLPLSVVLLSMVTSLIIRTINSNLSLSLGMVGALSIVRFRTAVKEPVDTVFMFWAITLGIMSGAGLYLVALFGSVVLGLFYYLMYLYDIKPKSEYLMVIAYKDTAEEKVEELLKDVSRKLKSRTINSQKLIEATYELVYNEDTNGLMNRLQEIDGVRNVSIVSYNNDFGL